MNKKVFWSLCLVMVLSLILSSCATTSTTSPKTTSTSQPATTTSKPPTTSAPPATQAKWWDSLGTPKYGGTITFRMTSLNPTFDVKVQRGLATYWYDALFVPDWTVDRKTWGFLTGYIPEQYYAGGLAQSWKWQDNQTLVIQLRQGVKWQDKPPLNGREFTADDIQFTFNRIMGTGSGYTQAIPLYSNFTNLIQTLTATDKYTITVKFKNPTMWLNLRQILELVIQPYEALEMEKQFPGTYDVKRAVGTGPFMLTDFVVDSAMTLSKNPNYWGYDERYPKNKLPYADTLKILSIPDIQTALSALRTGKIDTVSALDWKQAQSLAKTNPEIKQAQLPYGGPALTIRSDTSPFTDIRVRKALNMSVDRPSLAKGYYGGIVDGKPAGLLSPAYVGFVPPYDQWPQALKDEYSYNPAKAKQLLADAGFPNGFKTNVVASTVFDMDVLQTLKAFFKDISVEMDIQTMDPTTYTAFTGAFKADQLIAETNATTGSTNPPTISMNYRWSKGLGNYAQCKDATYDALYDKFYAVSEQADAQKIRTEAEMYFITQHWSVVTFPIANYDVWQPYLKGYSGETSASGDANRGWVWIAARLWIDQTAK